MDQPKLLMRLVLCSVGAYRSRRAVRVVSSSIIIGTQYVHGNIGATIYVASGNTVDWTSGTANVTFSYAVELRDTGKRGGAKYMIDSTWRHICIPRWIWISFTGRSNCSQRSGNTGRWTGSIDIYWRTSLCLRSLSNCKSHSFSSARRSILILPICEKYSDQ